MNRLFHKVEEGNLKNAFMGKFYITLISLCGLLFSAQFGWAQCPEKSQVLVQASGVESFEKNDGKITFSISDELAFDRKNYRIRLWEEGSQVYTFDDNAPPFLNTPALKVSGRVITFTKLPKGKYILELHGGDCNYQRFTVDDLSKVLSN